MVLSDSSSSNSNSIISKFGHESVLNELLARIIEAHGGMDRWKGYEKVEATLVSGGGFFSLKGTPQD